MTNAPGAEIVHAAAAAAITVLPAAEPLTVGTIASGDPQVAQPFAAAIVADIDGPAPGHVAVLVGQELVDVLAASPMGDLDPAAAIQPTLDAVAAALHSRAGAARRVSADQVVREIGGPFTVAFLHGQDVSAAVLIADTVVAGAHNVELADASTGAAPEPQATPALPGAAAAAGAVTSLDHHRHGIEILHGVDMEVTVEIGRTRMTVRDLLDLAPGAVLELDRAAGSPADLLVNGRLIARGEVVVIDEDFGLRITEIAADAAVAG